MGNKETPKTFRAWRDERVTAMNADIRNEEEMRHDLLLTDEEIMNIGLDTPVDRGLYWMRVGVLVAQAQLDKALKAFEQEKAKMMELVNSLDWESTAYQTQEGSPIIQIQMSEAEWQSKLKEWGVETKEMKK